MPKLPMHGGMLSPCKVRVDMKEHSGGGFKVTDYLALSKRGEKEKKNVMCTNPIPRPPTWVNAFGSPGGSDLGLQWH